MTSFYSHPLFQSCQQTNQFKTGTYNESIKLLIAQDGHSTPCCCSRLPQAGRNCNLRRPKRVREKVKQKWNKATKLAIAVVVVNFFRQQEENYATMRLQF